MQITAFLAAAVVWSGPSRQMLDRRVVWLSAAALLVMAMQLVPLPRTWIAPLRPEILQRDGAIFGFISLGVGRTVECLMFMTAALAFLFGLLRLRPDQLYGLLPFFFMGTICNVLAGAIQFSLVSHVAIQGFLPYTITAGLFANVNHFSALLFVSVPFIVFYAVFRGHMVSGALGLIAVLLLLLAAGSRAGVLIGLAITVIALFFLIARSRVSRLSMLAVFLFVSVYTVGAWSKLSDEVMDPKFGRREIARTTMEGIAGNWPIGIGFGNFQKAYQIYEKPEMIFRQYVNHAHNDYLEIIMEGGVLVGGLLAIYLVLLLTRLFKIRNNAFQKAAFLSICFLLVHSLVDYPLRTMALALSFAYFNAILFHLGLDGGRMSTDVYHKAKSA